MAKRKQDQTSSTISREKSGFKQGFFESKILVVAVGPSQTPLNVYEDALKKTAFFEVEGPPLIDTQREKRKKGKESSKVSQIPQSPVARNGVKTEEDQPFQVNNETTADYNLYHQDKFNLHPKAFKFFLLFLYDTPPDTPAHNEDYKGMMQAYCLARRYQCADIQNGIVDRFCQYHSKIRVRLDDLVWMVNRIGDNTECPMIACLTEQIAYEIAKHGLDDFKEQNSFLKRFLKYRDQSVHVTLFAALARHAAPTELHDPAVNPTRWHLPSNKI